MNSKNFKMMKYSELKNVMAKFTKAKPSKTITQNAAMGFDYGNFNDRDILKKIDRNYLDMWGADSMTQGHVNSVGQTSTLGSREDYVIFWGFSGNLKMKFSRIGGMSTEEVQSRLTLLKTSIPWQLMPFEEFRNAMISFTENFIEIPLDDAFNIIRIGEPKEVVDNFEEPEVDEFDDNCVETCKPGDHQCGK